jgi:hypothetical protein
VGGGVQGGADDPEGVAPVLASGVEAAAEPGEHPAAGQLQQPMAGTACVAAGGPADQRLPPRRRVGQWCGGEGEGRERLAVVQDADAGVEGGSGGEVVVVEDGCGVGRSRRSTRVAAVGRGGLLTVGGRWFRDRCGRCPL